MGIGTRNFREYKVWIDASNFAVEVYKITNEMPWFEKKGLCDQLQRASVSISSNIAEGSAKPTDAEFVKYLHIAMGSAYEVETQLLIANKIGYMNDEVSEELTKAVREIQMQIHGMIRWVKSAMTTKK